MKKIKMLVVMALVVSMVLPSYINVNGSTINNLNINSVGPGEEPPSFGPGEEPPTYGPGENPPVADPVNKSTTTGPGIEPSVYGPGDEPTSIQPKVINNSTESGIGVQESTSVINSKPSEWAATMINAAYQSNLVTDEIADYKQPIARIVVARYAVQLYEMITGKPVRLDSSVRFQDTMDDNVLKAASLGIIKGEVVNGKWMFNPTATIDRQQMAVIMARTISIAAFGGDVSSSSDTVYYYDDQSMIQPWANGAVQFCGSTGIMIGSDYQFNPRKTLNYEEAIVIIFKAYKAYLNQDYLWDTISESIITNGDGTEIVAQAKLSGTDEAFVVVKDYLGNILYGYKGTYERLLPEENGSKVVISGLPSGQYEVAIRTSSSITPFVKVELIRNKFQPGQIGGTSIAFSQNGTGWNTKNLDKITIVKKSGETGNTFMYYMQSGGCNVASFAMLLNNLGAETKNSYFDIRTQTTYKWKADPYTIGFANMKFPVANIKVGNNAGDVLYEAIYANSPMFVYYEIMLDSFGYTRKTVDIDLSNLEGNRKLVALLKNHPEGIVLRIEKLNRAADDSSGLTGAGHSLVISGAVLGDDGITAKDFLVVDPLDDSSMGNIPLKNCYSGRYNRLNVETDKDGYILVKSNSFKIHKIWYVD